MKRYIFDIESTNTAEISRYMTHRGCLACGNGVYIAPGAQTVVRVECRESPSDLAVSACEGAKTEETENNDTGPVIRVRVDVHNPKDRYALDFLDFFRDGCYREYPVKESSFENFRQL
jgi:hypothetical protein